MERRSVLQLATAIVSGVLAKAAQAQAQAQAPPHSEYTDWVHTSAVIVRRVCLNDDPGHGWLSCFPVACQSHPELHEDKHKLVCGHPHASECSISPCFCSYGEKCGGPRVHLLSTVEGVKRVIV